MHFIECVKEYLGWCPDQRMAPFRMETSPWPEMNYQSLPVKGSYVNNGVIIDYGKTGISLPFFIGAMIGVLGIVAFLILIMRITFFLQFRLLFSGLALIVGIVVFMRDLKKGSLEITPGALVITRFLHRKVIIRNNTISNVEIRSNVPPFPLWLQKVLILLVMPVSSAVIIAIKYSEYTSGEITSSLFFVDLTFYSFLVLFFLASYYHSRVRAGFPGNLVISTNTQNLVVIYGEKPEEIAGMLRRSE